MQQNKEELINYADFGKTFKACRHKTAASALATFLLLHGFTG